MIKSLKKSGFMVSKTFRLRNVTKCRRGEFYRILEPMLTSSDGAQRAKASLALRFGLSALAGDPVAAEIPDVND